MIYENPQAPLEAENCLCNYPALIYTQQVVWCLFHAHLPISESDRRQRLPWDSRQTQYGTMSNDYRMMARSLARGTLDI